MEQILVTIDDTQPSASIRNAIKMLRGVVSASIIKESPLTIEEKQKAYVKESLSRALQEVKLAKLQGEKLQNVDDFIREMKEAQPYGSGVGILTLNILLDAETMDITLLTIYDKGEISNVNDDYIKFLVENL